MKFISTRNKNEIVDSATAIIAGLAKDGGLYICDSIVPFDDIYTMKDDDYRTLAFEVISHLFDDIDKNDLKQAIDDAYGSQFYDDAITPLHQVGKDFFLDLSKGPTSAFKDIALQFLPRIMVKLRKDNKKIMILSATSGDTGKAALEGFKDVKNTGICVLYPQGMVSAIQKMQMVTTGGDNTQVIGVKGNFDDCQRLVKDILENEKSQDIHLSSANSINIARLIPQCVYYFKAYFDLLNRGEIKKGEPVDFVVPTGNFGDILAGYLAKCMGLPAGRLIIASNDNRVLTDFIHTGIYDANRFLINTASPSIDILISGNLERLLFLLSRDDILVAKLMKQLKEEGKYQVDAPLLQSIQTHFDAYSISEDECRKTIRETFEKYGYLIDPHTAVAAAAAQKSNAENRQVILFTASPFKFSKDVYYAISGKKIEDNLKAMELLADATHHPIPENLAHLKQLDIRHCRVIEKNDTDAIVRCLKGE